MVHSGTPLKRHSAMDIHINLITSIPLDQWSPSTINFLIHQNRCDVPTSEYSSSRNTFQQKLAGRQCSLPALLNLLNKLLHGSSCCGFRSGHCSALGSWC